ncbi:MAG: hypothetical protein AAF098_00040 [Pseudomonadota bacterium]
MKGPFVCEEHDGILVGPERSPLNAARDYGKGSIHDDSTAKELGFRGGAIAGSLHLEQFPPVLIASLGAQWPLTGGLSLYFKSATIEGEPVRVSVERPAPGAARVKTWLRNRNGDVIAEGTAHTGGKDKESTLRTRLANLPAANELQMLASVSTGTPTQRVVQRVPSHVLDERLKVITEPLEAYVDEAAFGGRVLTPALQVHMLSQAAPLLVPDPSQLGVGLYGAIELQHLGQPVFADQDYEIEAEALALGETPKTEFVYYESRLFLPGKDKCLSSMILMNRFMKPAPQQQS